MQWSYAALAMCLTACGGMSGPKTTKDINKSIEKRAAAAGEHFLVEPVGNPERLLGRAVTQGPSGGWVISDERAPGCTVRVRKTPSAWTRTFQESIENVGGVSASIPLFAKLKAEYNSRVFMLMEIDNSYTLEADLAGTCGDNVVDKVKVGTGTRGFSSEMQASFNGGVSGKQGKAKGGWAQGQNIKQAMTWKSPQGWAFSVRARKERNVKRLRMRLDTTGSSVPDCTDYQLKVNSDKEIYLVVIVTGDDGETMVFGPRQESPELKVPAGATLEILGATMYLKDPTRPASDKFTVYAFTSQEEYERMLPPFGHLTTADVNAYMAKLDKELAEMPVRRWSKKSIGVQTTPLTPPRTAPKCPGT